MARFRATAHGNRGEASRLGTTASGIVVTCDGWDDGVKVIGRVDETGLDVLDVYATGGSNARLALTHVGTMRRGAWVPNPNRT
jgi:hypothetical protein